MRFLYLLLFFIPFIVDGQRYPFFKYSTEEGLPQSQVTAICQDNEGYLWVGTLGGLAKFNGEKFTTYSVNSGLVNNRVKALNFFDGKLWVGLDGGISIIDHGKITSCNYDSSDVSREPTNIIKFKKHILVFSNRGGIHEYKNNKLVPVPIEEEFMRIRSAHVQNDTIFIATRSGVLYSSDGSHFNFMKDLDSLNFSGVSGRGDKLIFSTYLDGAFVRDQKTGSIEHISKDQIQYNTRGVYVDQSGVIWFSSQEGFLTMDNNRNFKHYNINNGLPVNFISCFYQDMDGFMWIGSMGKGLLRFPSSRFEYYDRSTGFITDLYLGGFQNSKGEYYLGTYDASVIKYLPGASQINVSLEQKMRGRAIWASLHAVDGADWFGTDVSLAKLDGNGKVTEYFDRDGTPGSKVSALFKINESEMFIGGSDGVSHYVKGKLTHISAGVELGTVRDFETLNGQHFCVSNLGLFQFNGTNFKSYLGIKGVIYCIEKDLFGNLWYGSEEGLFRIHDGKVDKIQLLNTPASDHVNFINRKEDRLFVGTNNGLFIISNLNDVNPKKARYGIGEGLLELETNLNSGFFDNENKFWFGTASGLVSYDMGSDEIRPSKPKLKLLKILLNYEEFEYKKYSKTFDKSGLPTDLILPYNKNNLIFEFDGISLIDHNGLSYQFKLDGLNEEWSPLSKNSSVAFNSLPAGEYTLHMRSVDMDGRVSDEVVYSFVIREAFYRTWWFIIILILIIGLLIFAFFRFRLKRIEERNLQEKLEIKTRLLSLEQKSINASMNRHFIFNALNSIQYFINDRDTRSANKYLTDFAKLIRMNLDTVNLDVSSNTLAEELERMELYLSLESMRFQDRFEYKINLNNVDPEAVHIPAMLMQPFVENSIIHGILPQLDRKGLITIDIRIIENELKIVIEDNGIGVNRSIQQKKGIKGDHKSQGMEITSKRIEMIKKLSDFDISLTGPDEIIDENSLINGTRVSINIKLKDFEF